MWAISYMYTSDAKTVYIYQIYQHKSWQYILDLFFVKLCFPCGKLTLSDEYYLQIYFIQ